MVKNLNQAVDEVSKEKYRKVSMNPYKTLKELYRLLFKRSSDRSKRISAFPLCYEKATIPSTGLAY
jgi:hypothetical protein